MSKKTTDQKTEKQTEAKKPVELKDNELDEVQGGGGSQVSGAAGRTDESVTAPPGQTGYDDPVFNVPTKG